MGRDYYCYSGLLEIKLRGASRLLSSRTEEGGLASLAPEGGFTPCRMHTLHRGCVHLPHTADRLHSTQLPSVVITHHRPHKAFILYNNNNNNFCLSLIWTTQEKTISTHKLNEQASIHTRHPEWKDGFPMSIYKVKETPNEIDRKEAIHDLWIMKTEKINK